MTTVDDTIDADGYDEFGLLHENAAEWDIPFEGPPTVARRAYVHGDSQTVSYIRWGTGEPELVFLHGGGQNAHTWDTVILALGRPAIAIDLPGHGHSDRRADKDYGPWRNAEVVAAVVSGSRRWLGQWSVCRWAAQRRRGSPPPDPTCAGAPSSST